MVSSEQGSLRKNPGLRWEYGFFILLLVITAVIYLIQLKTATSLIIFSLLFAWLASISIIDLVKRNFPVVAQVIGLPVCLAAGWSNLSPQYSLLGGLLGLLIGTLLHILGNRFSAHRGYSVGGFSLGDAILLGLAGLATGWEQIWLLLLVGLILAVFPAALTGIAKPTVSKTLPLIPGFSLAVVIILILFY